MHFWAGLPQLLENPVTPHTFRHTAAVHLVAAGFNVTVNQSWLGQVNFYTTFLYAQANVEMKRRATRRWRCETARTPPDDVDTPRPEWIYFLRLMQRRQIATLKAAVLR